ncbi:hypothetical protein C4568_03235 [Candidatus Parcubacteria bacterium]|nr:MAG: hypothetical protein C4568_03235 [Candidatus Parcubacteria bacterium]
MKATKYLATAIGCLLFSLILPTQASALSCFDVDGMSVFGYDGYEWIHIGAIGNEFNSLSIANEFGAGNEFKSTSIFNEFGKFGSKFSSYSAFNDFAYKPPIVVSDSYKFVGYMTTGYKFPSINTYEAIACANKSFRSPNRDMEDVTFKDIPSSSSSYSNSYYPSGAYSSYTPLNSCPKNSSLSTKDFSSCVCNTGYTTNAKKDACVPVSKKTNDKVCQKEFGSKSLWDGTTNVDETLNCTCKKGYSFDSKGTKCVKDK